MNKITKALWAIGAILLLFNLFACQQDEQTLAEETPQAETITHTDALGRTIETVNPKNIPFLVDYYNSPQN